MARTIRPRRGADADYDRIAEVTGQPVERVVPRGRLEAAATDPPPAR